MRLAGCAVRTWITSAGALAGALCISAATAHATPEMVLVPAGAFEMGNAERAADERPPHRISLAAFLIDRLPVSNSQFAEFLEAAGPRAPDGARYFDDDDADARIHRRRGRWRTDDDFGEHPVVEVSWLGAAAYCAWRGKRLPSEAEWEKAARGTESGRFPWGDEAPDATRARFGAGWNETAPVGSHARGASPYGALDMAGNVWQWVSSAYRPYPYSATDGREDPAPGPVRGTRGGGHDSPAAHLVVTHRGLGLSRNPAAGHHNIGFRCAKDAGR